MCHGGAVYMVKQYTCVMVEQCKCVMVNSLNVSWWSSVHGEAVYMCHGGAV
jgi:hypothetical protein